MSNNIRILYDIASQKTEDELAAQQLEMHLGLLLKNTEFTSTHSQFLKKDGSFIPKLTEKFIAE